MESIHGVDVSWMTQSSHQSHKEHITRAQAPNDDSSPSPNNASNPTHAGSKTARNDTGHQSQDSTSIPPKQILSHRPSFSKSNSSERTATLNGSSPRSGSVSPSTTRRNSWLSSISSKFSSSPGAQVANIAPSSPLVPATSPAQDAHTQRPLGGSAPRNAVLQHGSKGDGDAPYTPAPPKLGQPNFLQSALRRLSSGSQLTASNKVGQHGLCERRILNVDRHRERCRVSELEYSKLRRVAFCVDVEIASGPRYTEDDPDEKRREKKREKRKMTEKGEGEALKRSEEAKNEKEHNGIVKATGEELPHELEKEATESTKEVKTEDPPAHEKDCTKKKEKKKRSEEERKARKEKKRKLAEANGTVPVELVRNPSDSSLASTPPGSGTPKTQASPTTDPVRIYRRCCQLRETPILKKITEQLGAPSNASLGQPGIINKLDLSGYWLQLPDLVTLGDYLAVVPVRELVMENCGLTCEGVRVILAGLLAAKLPDFPGGRKTKAENGGKVAHHGGVVERVVFKNNTKIGREGWRYICLFMHMSRSLKCMDLSNTPLPQTPTSTSLHGPGHLKRSTSTLSISNDTPNLLAKAIGERLAGSEFELLNMAETGITTEQLDGLIDGVCKSGLRRLGLAGNNITPEGMEHVARYLREGKCEGLDLCGNDLKDLLKVLADALDESHSLFALSLADCNLTPDSLWKLFPALAKLRNFRFIDLSHNHDLFTTQPNALSLLRRYLPKMPILKRIHLTDVAMAPEQAIALAEILPESPGLAHVNIMENPQLAVLANARDEANQEEACALYASLMAAARVSKTIVCIDIDVPSSDSSEIVKALAKQVVAYCLRNMERDPVTEINHAAAEISELHGGENEIAVPDVLLHLVGHVEGFHENHDDDEPAPDEDYVIGGTGVVKALGICLRNKGDDSRRHSADVSDGGSGSASPKPPVRGGKAKDMSKNLLGSARKIRARLQPALVKEARAKDRMNYNRLLFLDQTLEGMIKRFEDEFPETRLPSTITSLPIPSAADASPSEGSIISTSLDAHCSDTEPALVEAHASDDEDFLRPVLSRHNSDVSLASKALSQEEGRMHRFGQQFRRDILKPEQEDHEHGTTGKETEAAHLRVLRAMVEGMGGEEIKKKIEDHGQDAIIQELSKEASILKERLREADPEGWDKFVEAQEVAQRNSSVAGLAMSVSAID